MKTRILIIIWIVLFVGFTGTVFAEKEWYPGIGLGVTDTFHYDACGMWDNTTCHPFEMILSVMNKLIPLVVSRLPMPVLQRLVRV